jgi:hypothetical protein
VGVERGEGGTDFGEGDACVGVLDGGGAAVGVEGQEGLLLDLGEGAEFGLVGEAELFEEEGDFPWVGALERGLVGRLRRGEKTVLESVWCTCRRHDVEGDWLNHFDGGMRVLLWSDVSLLRI